ncbi:DNA-binding domain-containing protein [Fodinibius sediminis]|uniref:Uncharacterized protein n=1 Tax=Fodinibius sediminis TaxID=1214077 RepID=A0A521D008_9BACT|nr:DNA-binding domain-containing protein [Fodinibius sediminis]SMO65047.1 protein of unknown function [Fodinibius sediminis]
MPLEFYLVPNRMTEDADNYIAISSNKETYYLEDIFDHMTREGSTITRAEALAGFEETVAGIMNLVEQGHSVVTPLVNISSSVYGVFDAEDDSFDDGRHGIRINLRPGKRLRDIEDDITIKKVRSRERKPVLRHYYDNGTETQDGMITPGAGARISGKLLKFDEEDSRQGVFFIDSRDSTQTRVDARMLRNMPGELIFNNPSLTAGTYRLEVRAMLEGISSIRTGVLDNELTVE